MASRTVGRLTPRLSAISRSLGIRWPHTENAANRRIRGSEAARTTRRRSLEISTGGKRSIFLWPIAVPSQSCRQVSSTRSMGIGARMSVAALGSLVAAIPAGVLVQHAGTLRPMVGACAMAGVAMLLTHAKFQEFTPKTICDATKSTEVLIALSCDSRERVTALVEKALAAGGTTFAEPKDYGFMLQHSFQDLDGHIWELFHMDESAIPPAQ